MREIIVDDMFGFKKKYFDLHSDLLLGHEYYPKIMPSSIREKLLEDAAENDNSEIKQIIDIVIQYYDQKNVNTTGVCNCVNGVPGTTGGCPTHGCKY